MESLRLLRNELLERQMANQLGSEEALLRFMSNHVFAVWDFQSLLKALQQRLTCVQVPWTPTSDREARRLINEIVLDEESGPHPDGGYASHFELYLDAMKKAGANTKLIEEWLSLIEKSGNFSTAITSTNLPSHVEKFLKTTFSFIEQGSLVTIASSFLYGREDIIPDLFRQLVQRLDQENPEKWGYFKFYLEEHIHCDEEKHGPAAERLMQRICGNDPILWAEAEHAARIALISRIELWDAMVASQAAKPKAA
ncbi:MAG: DUF3050 domain-containing protein [bacterium]